MIGPVQAWSFLSWEARGGQCPTWARRARRTYRFAHGERGRVGRVLCGWWLWEAGAHQSGRPLDRGKRRTGGRYAGGACDEEDFEIALRSWGARARSAHALGDADGGARYLGFALGSVAVGHGVRVQGDAVQAGRLRQRGERVGHAGERDEAAARHGGARGRARGAGLCGGHQAGAGVDVFVIRCGAENSTAAGTDV